MTGDTRPVSVVRRIAPGVRSMSGSVVLGAFAVVVFVLNVQHQRGPLVLLWVAAPLSTIVPVLSAMRIARTVEFARPTRRFWGQLACGAGLVGVGAVLNGYDAIGSGVATQRISVPTVATYGAAVLVILWGMSRLPLGVVGPGDRLRVGLDGGTVLLAAAVFMWHFQTRPLLVATGYRSTSVIGASFTLVLELLTVFAIAKVALAGHAYIARAALRLFAFGLVVGALSGVPQRFILDKPQLSISQVAIPLVMICATAAARRQQQALVAPDRRRTQSSRPFSMLPYLAVAAVDSLLLVSIWSGDDDQRATAAAAVTLTALVVWRQVTAFRENIRLLAELDHSSTHDSLTQLPNRSRFNQQLAAAVTAGTPDRRVSVALIDLDDFKIVNDTLGHGAGDALLVAVAGRLSGVVRPEDMVARLGGDEFVALLEDTEPGGAEQVAHRMIAALAEPVLADGHQLLVRASIGIAHGRGGDDVEELLRRADLAMYAAKRDGGSSFRSYQPAMAGAAISVPGRDVVARPA